MWATHPLVKISEPLCHITTSLVYQTVVQLRHADHGFLTDSGHVQFQATDEDPDGPTDRLTDQTSEQTHSPATRSNSSRPMEPTIGRSVGRRFRRRVVYCD
jgi:hypothetical protein